MKRRLSTAYLIAGSLGALGYLAFFNEWPPPLIYLFVVALLFCMATITITILVHPIVCATFLLIAVARNQPKTTLILHLAWSLTICSAFYGMFKMGYILSV